MKITVSIEHKGHEAKQVLLLVDAVLDCCRFPRALVREETKRIADTVALTWAENYEQPR